MIKVTRKTTESNISVTLSEGPLKPNYRKLIKTPISFLNHMIEHIAWRSGINIEADLKLDEFQLNHLICEDTGITMGKCLAGYLEDMQKKGAAGFGDGIGIIDEAMAIAAVSFESRARFDFKTDVSLPVKTEDMDTEDLKVFLDGIAIGANMTLHLNILKGENSHHIWEAAFRAIGTALNRALSESPERLNMTSGVAGRIEFEIER